MTRVLTLVLLATALVAVAPHPAHALTATLGDGLVVYMPDTIATPKYRTYTSSSNSFGSATNATAGSGATTTDTVLRTSPLKQEAIYGFLDNSGNLNIMCFDGTTWSQEWSVSTVNGDRPFDIAYEQSTGNVMVLYSRNVVTTNELAYRTKPNSAGCGAGNWSAATNVDPVRTTAQVRWVHIAADRRPNSQLMTALISDVNGGNARLTAMTWSGTAWGNEPASLLDGTLEYTTGAGDVEAFDVDYESVSGDVMVTWGDHGGGNGTNGAYYATCTGGTANCTWSSATAFPTFNDDATSLDLSPNPGSDEMVFASIGDAGGSNLSHLQIGYWSGSAWTDTPSASLDQTTSKPSAFYRIVTTGWLINGAATRSVITYRDADSNVSYYSGNGSTFTLQSDFVPTPTFTSLQESMMTVDPFNMNRALYLAIDNAKHLAVKQVSMDSSGAFTWTNADGGSALDTTMQQSIAMLGMFAYWRNGPVYGLPTSATIDPELTFSIAGQPTTCNGVAVSAGTSSSASTVSLGHPSAAANTVASQDITVTTNAVNGFTVYTKYSGTMNDGAGHTIADIASTNASPGAFPSVGTAGLGYTTSDSSLGTGTANRFTNPSAKWAKFTTSNAEVSYSATGYVSKTICVAYQVGAAGSTPAGSYAASIAYTAVPVF